MAVEIGALRALLSLDSAAFDSGAKRAQASMNGLQRSLRRTADNMQKIGRRMSTLVTAPIVAATALMARSAVRNAVEIERLSQVANAGTTEFQRFAAGARDVGIEQDKLADILKDVNDRVGDFVTTGGGPMADFFENVAPKIGITADAFKGLSGPQALQLYVSSLEKAGLSQQEMTFYMEAMASDATLLLPLLKDNGKEMGRLADMAAKAGTVMDEKTIKALGRADDAMRAAGDAARGLFTEIMMSLAPVMESIAEKVGAAARWFSSLSPEMKKLIGVAAVVAAAIGPLAIALGFVAVGLAALVSPIGAAVLAFGAVVGVAGAIALNWDKLVKRFPILETGLTKLKGVFSAAWEGIKGIVKGAADIVNGAIDLIVGVLTGDLTRAVEGLTGIWDGWVAITDAAINAVLGVIEAIVPGFRQAVADIIAAVSSLPGKLKQWGIDAIQGFVDGIVQKWQELKASVMSIFSLDDASAAAIKEGEKLGDDHARGTVLGMDKNKPVLGAKAAELQQHIIDAARTESETRSPSRVWMDLGRDLMDGLNIGIADGAQAAATSAAAAANQVTAAASAAAPVISTIPDTLRDASVATSDLGGRLAGMFSSAAQGAKSLSGFLSNVLIQLGNMLTNSAFKSLFSGIGGGGGGFLSSLFSFDGGGYTGAGARSGGVDGKGGFPAILHPNETVVDHSRGQSGAGGSQRVEIVLRAPEGFTAEQMNQVQGVAIRVTSEGISSYDRTTLPKSISRIGDDPRRRG